MADNDNLYRAAIHYTAPIEREQALALLERNESLVSAEYDGLVETLTPLNTIIALRKEGFLVETIRQETGLAIPESFSSKESDELINRSPEATAWINRFSELAAGNRLDIDQKKIIVADTTGTAETSSFESAEIDLPVTSLPEAPGLYKLIFRSALDAFTRTFIHEQDVILLAGYEEQSPYCYTALLNTKQLRELQSLPQLLTITGIPLQQKISTRMIDRFSTPVTTEAEAAMVTRLFDVALVHERFLEPIVAIIVSSGMATIIDSGLNLVRIETDPDQPLLATLGASPWVVAVTVYEPPALFCDVARKNTGIDFPTGSTSWEGNGQAIGVIDSGVDDQHPDLRKRVKKILTHGEGQSSDQSGHGTHVSGIICGEGNMSKKNGGSVKGMAPAAELVMLGVLAPGNRLELPADMGVLLEKLRQENIQLVNMSLGYPVHSDYMLCSYSVDKYVYDHPEMLVVVAAGNEGMESNGRLAYKTLSAPGTAKNVLTVGAIASTRTSPSITQTWGDRKPGRFPKPPFNAISLFSPSELVPSIESSSGPSDYDSIKPEVVAPGNYILSCKSSLTAINPASKEYYSPDYVFNTGTSMAAPVVTGLVALVKEFLVIRHNCPEPSASLLKAIMVASANRIASNRKEPDDKTHKKIGFPDFDQGFGLVNLSGLLNEQNLQLAFADIASASGDALESRAPIGGTIKSSRQYSIKVKDNAAPLTIVLCWTDPAGKGIQNNLQLLARPRGGTWQTSNSEHVFRKDVDFDLDRDNLMTDRNNNTQKIQIPAPVPGEYKIRVIAQNTISRQGYSLVIIGHIEGLIVSAF